MKTRIYSIALGLFLVTACTKVQPIRIAGELPDGGNIVLFGQNGEDVNELQVDDDFLFHYEGTVPGGYYFLDGYMIYLQPGFDLVISVGEEENSIVFEGKGAVFNNFIQKSTDKFMNLRYDNDAYNKDEKSFKSHIQQYIDWVDQELKNLELAKNQHFVSNEKKKAGIAVKEWLFSYISQYTKDNNQSLKALMMYTEAINDDEWENPEIMEKYNELEAQVKLNRMDSITGERLMKEIYADFDINDSDLFRTSDPSSPFITLLDRRIRDLSDDEVKKLYDQYGENEYPPSEIAYANYVKSNVTNKNTKEYLLKHYALSMFDGAEEKYIEPFIKDFKSTVTNPQYINEVEEVYNEAKLIAPGSPSPKFVDYENHAGGKSSLDDFKGKYVYIDFWATWCGPCKAEIPYLKAIEEKFHGKNIAFVSISLDSEADYEAWKKMVVDLEATGIQLIADKEFDSDFVSAYRVSAIPRFVLLDHDGNIISSNARAPSDPQLEELLDSFDL